MAPLRKPFRQDPSATAAFAALRPAAPAPRQGERQRAVVIGGGTGAPMSIRTLLSLGLETSAVVAMADDGGSTGILREEADVTPPGDVRKCIAAFARDPNDPLTRAFKYRFSVARNHTLGNLMLAALEDASGSFPEAVRICERLLDAQTSSSWGRGRCSRPSSPTFWSQASWTPCVRRAGTCCSCARWPTCRARPGA